MTADGLPGSARGGAPCVCSRGRRRSGLRRGPMTGCRKALLILERMTVNSRQTTLVTELKVGLCNVCFRGKQHKFSEANASRHLKYLLGNSQPEPAADSLRHDAGSGPETCFVCTSHSLFVLGGVGSISFPPSFVPRVPSSVVLHKVLGRDAVTALRKPTRKFQNFRILEFLINEETLKEDPLEEGMATHSSILAWRIPWKGKLGGLSSMES